LKVSEKEIKKELREHPWADRTTAARIALDHRLRKTTSKEGKRLYMKDYMRQKRQQPLRFPSVSAAIGLKGGKQKGNLLSFITEGKKRGR
jgi:hypothetical protein